MSIFVDKAFEEMDWLSQAVEPWIDPFIDLFAETPDEIVVTEKHLERVFNPSYNQQSLYVEDVITAELKSMYDKYKDLYIPYAECIILRSKFDFYGKIGFLKREGDTHAFDSELVLRKKPDAMITSAEMVELTRDLVRHHIYKLASKANTDRVLELAQIMGVQLDGTRKKTRHFIQNQISSFIIGQQRENKWRIRSRKAFEDFLKAMVAFSTTGEDKHLALVYKTVETLNRGYPLYKCEL
jgi:hypothetical protein